MLPVAGFAVLAFMFTAYVILDGYDLGIAAALPFVAKSAAERTSLLDAIGPFWSGNEVWLIASGATLFALFPQAYAASFSGFYLPFMVVLWLLVFRGIALGLRASIDNDMWRTLCDGALTFASALLSVFFGVAFGNLIRGVDVEPSGFFFGTFATLLNPFALLTGLFALLALTMHGLFYAGMRVGSELSARCRAAARRVWWAVLALYLAVTASAFAIYHHTDPHPILSAALALAALGALIVVRGVLPARRAFYASSTFLSLTMIAAACTLFPFLIPRYPRGSGGLTIYAASSQVRPAAFATMMVIVIVALVALFAYRTLAAIRIAHPPA